jgi:hypothetical protein
MVELGQSPVDEPQLQVSWRDRSWMLNSPRASRDQS